MSCSCLELFCLSLWRRNPVCDSPLDSICNPASTRCTGCGSLAPSCLIQFTLSKYSLISSLISFCNKYDIKNCCNDSDDICTLASTMCVLSEWKLLAWCKSNGYKAHTHINLQEFIDAFLSMRWELIIFRFLSRHHRQHHKGQRVRGDDADWLWSNGHQDPPHQVLHHPAFASGQPHRHIFPALPDWQPGRASCRRANGICLRSEQRLYYFNSNENPWTQTEHLRPQLTFFFFFFYLNLVYSHWLHHDCDVDLNEIQSSQYKASFEIVSTGQPHSLLALISGGSL